MTESRTLGVPADLEYHRVATWIRGRATPEERRNLAYLLKQLDTAATEARLWDYHPGDIVRFTAAARPQYLVGLTAQVIRLAQKRVVIRIDSASGGRFQGEEVRCPLSIIEKVS